MKQPLFGLLAILIALTASAQQPAKDSTSLHPGTEVRPENGPRPGNYSADSFRLRTPGQRISLYAFCTPYSEGRAVYFRKDQDEAIHRLTIRNLRVALADNPASMHELRIAGTSAYLTIGLFVGGAALTAAGFIITSNHDRALQNAYNQASAKWYTQSLTNPNTPMPAPPKTSSFSPLVAVGIASTLSCFIPMVIAIKHKQKAIDIYNGIN